MNKMTTFETTKGNVTIKTTVYPLPGETEEQFNGRIERERKQAAHQAEQLAK